MNAPLMNEEQKNGITKALANNNNFYYYHYYY